MHAGIKSDEGKLDEFMSYLSYYISGFLFIKELIKVITFRRGTAAKKGLPSRKDDRRWRIRICKFHVKMPQPYPLDYR